jgi:hypothetical protein
MRKGSLITLINATKISDFLIFGGDRAGDYCNEHCDWYVLANCQFVFMVQGRFGADK